MHDDAIVERLPSGAAAGLAGTFLIQGLLAASQKWARQSLPPIKQDSGEFIAEKTQEQMPQRLGEDIPVSLKKAAAKSLAIGYGPQRSAPCTGCLVRR